MYETVRSARWKKISRNNQEGKNQYAPDPDAEGSTSLSARKISYSCYMAIWARLKAISPP